MPRHCGAHCECELGCLAPVQVRDLLCHCAMRMAEAIVSEQNGRKKALDWMADVTNDRWRKAVAIDR